MSSLVFPRPTPFGKTPYYVTVYVSRRAVLERPSFEKRKKSPPPRCSNSADLFGVEKKRAREIYALLSSLSLSRFKSHGAESLQIARWSFRGDGCQKNKKKKSRVCQLRRLFSETLFFARLFSVSHCYLWANIDVSTANLTNKSVGRVGDGARHFRPRVETTRGKERDELDISAGSGESASDRAEGGEGGRQLERER